MFDDEITTAAAATLEAARRAGTLLVTVESCTGGLVAAALTAVAGSSDVVHGGFVTYANEAKMALGVPAGLIEAHGAVSREVAEAMATAGRDHVAAMGRSCLAVAITGVAGPGGGSAQKPVGLVHVACADRHSLTHQEMRYGDVGRNQVRRASVLTALEVVRAQLPR